MDTATVRDKRDGFPIFIHSELDDYGLSAIEFRVYARLARRAGENGVAKESIPNMAETFMVSTQTVRRCLAVLRQCRLITEKPRPGKPTIYTLNPRKVWADKKELPTIRAGIFAPTPTTTTPTPDVTPYMTDRPPLTSQAGVPLTPQVGEGNPIEGNPEKEIHSPPNGGAARRADRDANLDHPAVTLYRNVCRLTPNRQQRADIVSVVTDVARYEQVLRKFLSEGRPPQRVDWTLERYSDNGTHQRNLKRGNGSKSDFQFKPKSIIR